MTDITCIDTGSDWLYPGAVPDLHAGIVVGWFKSLRQIRDPVLQVVPVVLWQRENRSAVILHPDRGCQFTGDEYQRIQKGHSLIRSMSGIGSGADHG